MERVPGGRAAVQGRLSPRHHPRDGDIVPPGHPGGRTCSRGHPPRDHPLSKSRSCQKSKNPVSWEGLGGSCELFIHRLSGLLSSYCSRPNLRLRRRNENQAKVSAPGCPCPSVCPHLLRWQRAHTGTAWTLLPGHRNSAAGGSLSHTLNSVNTTSAAGQPSCQVLNCALNPMDFIRMCLDYVCSRFSLVQQAKDGTIWAAWPNHCTPPG
ncbi:uncharacterized protein LOC134417919 [Melospiza melodia melodia]|uniref:uncharacterized protein LOC134417919 n=1 Tax=Melospiza melodia melodia TaxID=1914991 RepID=UPI002FD2B801